MLLDPFDGISLIEKTGVQLALGLDFGRGQEAKCTKSILDLDDDELVVVGVDPYAGVIDGSEELVASAIFGGMLDEMMVMVSRQE